MSAEPKQSELIVQINHAWEQAQEQLEKLKLEVLRTSQMAQASLQAKFLGRDRDRAFRDLGEAVWIHMRKGKLQLPPALTAPVKAVLEVEKKLESQSREINDLLKEGEEAAARMKAKKAPRNSVVAGKGKKR